MAVLVKGAGGGGNANLHRRRRFRGVREGRVNAQASNENMCESAILCLKRSVAATSSLGHSHTKKNHEIQEGPPYIESFRGKL